MVIYSSVDEWLRDCLSEAKEIVEEEILGHKLLEKIVLVNTERWKREYRKTTGKIPTFYAGFAGDEYGRIETHEEKYFIFLHDTLVQNWLYGDIISTLVHEILHIHLPQKSEEEISEMERYTCKSAGIKPRASFR